MILSSEDKTKNPWLAEVTSISKDGKTAKVAVNRMVLVALYGKRLKRVTSLLVDVADAEVKCGQKVQIVPCRKISKCKSWRVCKA